MSFPQRVALRYLFARKSTAAINWITGIAVFGLAIGTAALILVLSVFNGFEDLLGGLFGFFNPDLKIEAEKGKFFPLDSAKLAAVRALPEVEAASACLQEIAFFEYDGSQDFGTIKGVDDQFVRVTGIDSTIREGKWLLEQGEGQFAVLGAGMRNKLAANVNDPFSSILCYMPAKKASIGALEKPFISRQVAPAGTFAIQQDFDNEYILASFGLVEELLQSSGEVSSIEIKIRKGASLEKAKASVAEIIGPGCRVRDRREQNESFLKLMRLEKWLSFAILSLTLLLMAFNLIGALWMIVLDKQKDLATLRALGADDSVLRKIFLNEGFLLAAAGFLLGTGLALGLYFLQKRFDLIRIPEGFLVDSYPIALRAGDFLPIAAVVAGIGFLASWPAARRAAQVPSFFRDE